HGTKVFTFSSGAKLTGRVVTTPVNGATASSAVLEDEVGPAGFITDDGQFVVYRSNAGGLRRASTGATPAPKTLAASAKGLLGVTLDHSRMMFRSLAATQDGVDIRTADTTT